MESTFENVCRERQVYTAAAPLRQTRPQAPVVARSTRSHLRSTVSLPVWQPLSRAPQTPRKGAPPAAAPTRATRAPFPRVATSLLRRPRFLAFVTGVHEPLSCALDAHGRGSRAAALVCWRHLLRHWLARLHRLPRALQCMPRLGHASPSLVTFYQFQLVNIYKGADF